MFLPSDGHIKGLLRGTIQYIVQSVKFPIPPKKRKTQTATNAKNDGKQPTTWNSQHV